MAIVVITGVSPNGLGEALALAIASQSPSLLILVSRTKANLEKVHAKIASLSPNANVRVVVCDLGSLKSVRAAAGEIVALVREKGGGKGQGVVLFNNAGVNMAERVETEDGFEMQIGVNHFGGFLLSKLLVKEGLLGNGKGRVVNVSSEAHRMCPFRFGDWNAEGKAVPDDEKPRRGIESILRGNGRYEPWIAYAQSKTANVLHVVGLRKRGVRSFGVHPGSEFFGSSLSSHFRNVDEKKELIGVDIMTPIVRNLDELGWKGIQDPKMVWKTQDQGAATMVVAGFDPALISELNSHIEKSGMVRKEVADVL